MKLFTRVTKKTQKVTHSYSLHVAMITYQCPRHQRQLCVTMPVHTMSPTLLGTRTLKHTKNLCGVYAITTLQSNTMRQAMVYVTYPAQCNI